MHRPSLVRSSLTLTTLLLALSSAGPLRASEASTPGAASTFETTFEPASLDDRVACERALEATRYDLRLWPAVNPGPKPVFDAVVSEARLEERAIEPLLATTALRDVWQVDVEPRHLQAELDRMAVETRRPAALELLFDALDRDAARAAECLARPALTRRWLRERFEDRPPASNETSFGAWWRALRPTLAAARPTPARVGGFEYRLPTIDPSRSDDSFKGAQPDLGAWSSTPSLPLRGEGEMVWTGSEVLFYPRFGTLGYSYDPATDRWETLNTIGAASSRRDFSVVWTGTEMIVWGGCSATNHGCTLSSGARYDPLTDSWQDTGLAPTARVRHGAVWSGTEMLVFGGCRYVNDVCSNTPDQGVRYDPATSEWALMTEVGSPPGHTFVGLVWTGDVMIVWDGQGVGGGRYDPTTDTWAPVSEVDAPPGRLTTVVWTGEEMIAWGGCTGTPQCIANQSTGGRYDPVTDTWDPTSLVGAPGPRVWHSAVWTGEEMIVWGGADEDSFFGDGARYDPETDTWTPLSTQNDPSPRRNHPAVWTGTEMVVWGGVPDTRTGARYDPATDTWTTMRREDPNSLRQGHTAVWTGAEMIAWGGEGGGVVGPLDTGRRYDPATAEWSVLPATDHPASRNYTMLWTGSAVILWSGVARGPGIPGEGHSFDPTTDQWTEINRIDAPDGRAGHTAVWSGTEMIVWGGGTGDSGYTTTGGRYDPATDTWTPTNTDGAPEGRIEHEAVWASSSGPGNGTMVVWGGKLPTTSIATGGRYDPATDSWSLTTMADAPTPRVDHTMLWTGDRVIVWGGIRRELAPDELSERGHLYDPSTDTWTLITTVDAPSPRVGHTAVWTGDRMIVWGACGDDAATCLDPTEAGGLYDPVRDAWSPIAVANAPEPRSAHTAVWTGREMIVWAGWTVRNGWTNTGGIYVPPSTGLFSDGFESGDMSVWQP